MLIVIVIGNKLFSSSLQYGSCSTYLANIMDLLLQEYMVYSSLIVMTLNIGTKHEWLMIDVVVI